MGNISGSTVYITTVGAGGTWTCVLEDNFTRLSIKNLSPSTGSVVVTGGGTKNDDGGSATVGTGCSLNDGDSITFGANGAATALVGITVSVQAGATAIIVAQ